MNTARFFGGLCLFVTLAKCNNVEDPNWKLYFEDTFSGNSLNTSVWNVWNNQTHGDREWQLYLADEVSVSDGNLVIRTSSRTEMYGKKQYNFTVPDDLEARYRELIAAAQGIECCLLVLAGSARTWTVKNNGAAALDAFPVLARPFASSQGTRVLMGKRGTGIARRVVRPLDRTPC